MCEGFVGFDDCVVLCVEVCVDVGGVVVWYGLYYVDYGGCCYWIGVCVVGFWVVCCEWCD